MKLEFVPMLEVQRDLYRIERGSGRFHEYLQTMLDPETGELRLPLTMMNPMAKEHLPKYLDLLQAIGAEDAGARAVEEAPAKLGEEPGHYRVGIVVADDAGGGWTHRAASELMHLQGELALEKRGWITPILWSSETYGPPEIREEVLISIYRAIYVARRGAPRTLRDILLQEGSAMRLAGARNPALEPGRAHADARDPFEQTRRRGPGHAHRRALRRPRGGRARTSSPRPASPRGPGARSPRSSGAAPAPALTRHQPEPLEPHAVVDSAQRGAADSRDQQTRWPAAIAIVGLGGSSLALPDFLVPGPRWLLPIAVVVLLIPALFAHAGRHHRWIRCSATPSAWS